MTALRRRGSAAGADVAARRFDGAMHSFLGMIDVVPASAAGIDFLVAELERRLG